MSEVTRLWCDDVVMFYMTVVVQMCNQPLDLVLDIYVTYVQTLLYFFLRHLWECFHSRGVWSALNAPEFTGSGEAVQALINLWWNRPLFVSVANLLNERDAFLGMSSSCSCPSGLIRFPTFARVSVNQSKWKCKMCWRAPPNQTHPPRLSWCESVLRSPKTFKPWDDLIPLCCCCGNVNICKKDLCWCGCASVLSQ